MNLYMTEKWNSVVKDDDTVYHLGDFALKQSVKNFSDKLNGNKILILGNHDRESQCISHFKEVHKKLEIEIAGEKVLLCHYYYKDVLGEYDHKFKDRMPERSNNQWLLHGHAHDSQPKLNAEKRMINCSVEHWNYTPIPEYRIIEIITEREK